MRPPSTPPSAVAASSSSAVRSRPSSSVSGNPTSNSRGASSRRQQQAQQLPSSPAVTLFPDGATLVDDNAYCGSDPDGTHKAHPKPPLRSFFSLRSLQLQWLLLRRRRRRINRGRPDDDEGGDCRRARRQFCGSRVKVVGIAVVGALVLWLLLIVFHPFRRPRGGWWEGRWWNSLASNRKEPWFRTKHKAATTRARRLPPPYQVSDAVRQRNDLYDPSRDPILSNLLGDERFDSNIKQGVKDGVRSARMYLASACHADENQQVPVRVLLLTKQRPRVYFRHPHDDNSSLMSDEVLNIGQAGFRQSKCFRLLHFTIVPDVVMDDPHFDLSHDLNMDEPATTTAAEAKSAKHVMPPAVWVVDMRRHSTVIQGGKYTILQELVILVNNTLGGVPQVDGYDHEHSSQHNRQRRRRRRRLVVVLMDFRDYVPESSLCKSMAPLTELVQLLGPGHVRYVLQQTVKNRKWNYDANFVDLGNVYDPRPDAICWGGRALLQIPYTVRDDVADAVHQLATSSSSASSPSRQGPPPGPAFFGAASRPIDASHLWEIDDACRANKAVPRVRMQCELRNRVTQTLLDAFASTKYTVRTRIADSLGLRTVVQHEYVQTLVQSKIVVVSQRDLWEDSYRLMESLVSGALVMTDPMLTLPTGLVDRESIVIYQNLSDLVVLVEHYLQNDAERLAIAKRGYEVATTMHRPHHWMERLFFGNVVTP